MLLGETSTSTIEKYPLKSPPPSAPPSCYQSLLSFSFTF